MSVIKYKCPSCGADISFDSGTQQMVCPYCGTTVDMDALRSLDEALANTPDDRMDWQRPQNEWHAGELENMRVYACHSCGGEIIGDETLAATSCPYCGSHIVMAGQFAGALRPDLVIPFKLDKNEAVAALQRHYRGKLLLPKVFKDQNHIEEIKGLYVPFWLFDAESDAEIHYLATRVRSWSDSQYHYTETSHYDIERKGDIGFVYVPVDGSSEISNDLMESLEPFRIEEAVDFQTAYLAGYFADKYDVDADSCIRRANERIKKTVETTFARTVNGYHSVVPRSTHVNLKSGRIRYALFPIWVLGTSWRGKRYLFAMNGQTGAFAGDELPVSWGAYWLGVLILTTVFAPLVFYLIGFLTN